MNFEINSRIINLKPFGRFIQVQKTCKRMEDGEGKAEEVQIQILALDPNSLPKFCSEGNLSIVKELIENGADVNASNKDEETPLHAAVRANSIDCVNLLLEKGAFVDPLDSNGSTPIHYAAEIGSVVILETLIETAIKRLENSDQEDEEEDDKPARKIVCLPNTSANTALHLAAHHGLISFLKQTTIKKKPN